MEKLSLIKLDQPQTFLQASEPSPACDICGDTGFELTNRGARLCECRRRIARQSRLAKIPPKFRDVELATITATPEQEPWVTTMRQDPAASYFLSGSFGVGKSLLMWALYRDAVERGVPGLVTCTLTELLNEYRMFFQGGKYPRLSSDQLRQSHTRYSLFFDDIDKAKPTEYAAEQFFEIVNAVYEYGHQIVVTTNLNTEQLADHFDRADERFGGAIVRRLVDNVRIVEMF